MGWRVKSPSVFPAKFFSIIRITANDPGIRYPLISGSYEECFIEAERLRYFKYCVRQTQEHEIFLLTQAFDIRSEIINNDMNYDLMVYARPNKLTEFARLNPDLAEECFRECQ